MKKLPFLTFALGAYAWVVFASPSLTSELEFSRDALAGGELWRLFTGHLTHFSAEHLRWDLLVFVALGALVELRSRAHFVCCVVGGALLISLGVWWLQPQFVTYRGLSGIDSALFAYVAVDVLVLGWAERRWHVAGAAAAALVLFLAKVMFEVVFGQTVFVSAGDTFDPVPLAHLLGAVVGAVSASASAKRWRPGGRPRSAVRAPRLHRTAARSVIS
jgi:rhomboid family GlyGly-CTERM serine protease